MQGVQAEVSTLRRCVSVVWSGDKDDDCEVGGVMFAGSSPPPPPPWLGYRVGSTSE